MENYAIFSVTDKSGIIELARNIAETHTILASGGTAKVIRESGIDVLPISEFTGQIELFGGRVKTLHPRIHGGILFKNTKEDITEASTHKICSIDLVVCNLYDFETAVTNGSTVDEIIEKIDIGGPTLIRAAAKNYDRVTIVVDPLDYLLIQTSYAEFTKEDRFNLARKAFDLVTHYDLAISSYFNSFNTKKDSFGIIGNLQSQLRYGENPHQSASYYSWLKEPFYNILNGSHPSYNNLLDVTAGWYLLSEFDMPTCVIVKHRSPCGVASASNLTKAYQDALDTDKMSAYGGVYLFNRGIDKELALEIVKMFVDILIAPEISEEALRILITKKNLKILQIRHSISNEFDLNLVPGGFVVQDRDMNVLSRNQFEVVSDTTANEYLLNELLFAWKVAKHSRSNAIVISTQRRTLGIGSGQTSRVDATYSAINRAGEATHGAVMASDAFFPFSDSIEKAAEVGIKAIISPKGSIRDQEVIEAANRLGIILVFTTIRSFKH